MRLGSVEHRAHVAVADAGRRLAQQLFRGLGQKARLPGLHLVEGNGQLKVVVRVKTLTKDQPSGFIAVGQLVVGEFYNSRNLTSHVTKKW